MNLFSFADSADTYLKRVRYDEFLIAVRLVVVGAIGASALWYRGPGSPEAWGMILLAVYLAARFSGNERPATTGSQAEKRMLAAVRPIWETASISIGVLVGLACDFTRRADWGLLVLAAVFCTNIFGPALFVRFYRRLRP